MKSKILMIAIFACLEVSAQPQWTVPIRITSGTGNEVHPTIAEGFGWLGYGQEELLAFSRKGKDICVMKTTLSGAHWSDSLVWITTDSADNDYPSVVRTFGENGMLVWQARKNNSIEILASRLRNGSWSSPRQITDNSLTDLYPHAAMKRGTANDSDYFAVWEQGGKIMFSEYALDSWTPPEQASPVGDTLNFLPQVTMDLQSGNYVPLVVWQRRNAADSAHAIVASRRLGTVWSSPDTLVAGGDNRRPRFYKYASGFLTWDHVEAGNSITQGGFLSVSGGKIRVSGISQIGGPDQNQENSSVNGMMIITAWPGSPAFIPHGPATWQSTTLDSISVSRGIYSGPFNGERLAPAGSTANRNPTISQGTIVLDGGFKMRFWSVWESRVGNTWQLFGSYTTILVGDVQETGTANGFRLYQNYPNPFNPTTTIRYSLSSQERDGVRSHVTLKVFDVLGREVATLVDEMKDAGEHSVTFDAGNLPSGVYFYRMTSGTFVETRKLMLIK